MISGTALIGTGADSPWIYALYEAFASFAEHPVIALRFGGSRNVKASNKTTEPQSRLKELVITVPPAYATHLHWLTKGYLTRTLSRIYAGTAKESGASPFLVITNPAIERWTRSIPDDRLIYWNFDDYRLFQPVRSSEIEAWESALIKRARLVLCASRTQQLRFQDWLPRHAAKIFHFPNAVRREWIPETPNVAVQPGTVGYVGNMGERVDWQLVHDIALACPDRRFIFVGGVAMPPGQPAPEWVRTRQCALALPNVESIGRVPQAEVWRWYQSFELGWMPYDIRHPFNIACCPTKIFDSLATGRPFVSTAVPECLLYLEQIPIIESSSQAPEAFSRTLAEWSLSHAERQLSFARANDWHARARWLIDQLDNSDH